MSKKATHTVLALVLVVGVALPCRAAEPAPVTPWRAVVGEALQTLVSWVGSLTGASEESDEPPATEEGLVSPLGPEQLSTGVEPPGETDARGSLEPGG